MVSWVIGLLFLCICTPNLRYSKAIPIKEEDNGNGRSYKRELELFINEVQDNWEHDDNEYLSRRELQEMKDQSKRNKISSSSTEEKKEKDKKRWLNVDSKNNVLQQTLSPEYQDELPKDGDLFQEDIVMDPYVRQMFSGESTKRDVINMADYYWPGGILPFEFDQNIDPTSREQILKAMDDYHKYTCIQFRPRSEEDTDYVRFISNGSRCYSNVGRHGGEQEVSIGNGCYRIGTPIHEIMHVLGFFHEMARPDRDSFVSIHWNNIQEGLKHNFRMVPKEMDRSLLDYNVNSVLQYSNYAFSKNAAETITSITNPERQFGQRCGFSVGDILGINILYNCTEYNSLYGLNNRSIDEIICDDRN